MSKRRVHSVSDSDDDDDCATKGRGSATPSVAKSAFDEEVSKRVRSAVEGSTCSKETSTKKSRNDNKALEVVNSFSEQDQASLLCLDNEDENVERTPRSFRVVDAPTRGSRKLKNVMFAFVVDRSPAAHDDLKVHAGDILKRKVIDTFMRMRFDKNTKHHAVVLSCCDKDTNNLSNQKQPKSLNKHCVELMPTGELTRNQIQTLSNASDFKPESEQFSNVIAGLMTAADLISRSSEELEYDNTEITLFSDLVFDPDKPAFRKMFQVLVKVFPNASLTVISNADVITSEMHKSNLQLLKITFAQIELLSYQEAVERSKQWTMAEQMPAKFAASIKLLDQEIPIEAYIFCNDKNQSVLKTRLEKVPENPTEPNSCIDVAESLLREEKRLVKLTNDGHYMKHEDGLLVTVNPERASLAFKFGTTAVPSEKKLTEYTQSEPNHRGYVVRGWYPVHEFVLHVSGGRAQEVFPATQYCSVFDSLLLLCAHKGYALLVDYAYNAIYEAKAGVLIPHRKKRCFVFYDLVYRDNLNYLPRYDPIPSLKPPVKNIEKMCDLIAASQLTRLELKYDPQDQQVIDDCWSSILGETQWKHHERFADVTFRKNDAINEKIEEFKESAGGFVRRLLIKEETAEPGENDDRILFNVEPLDSDQIEKIKPRDFKSLFKNSK